MRPEPVDNRPFFRPEAERYRLQRHLDTIVLFRPLSLRLVTLYPLAVIGLLVFAATQIEVQQRFVAVLEGLSSPESMVLVLDHKARSALQIGDEIDLRLAAEARQAPPRARGEIVEVGDADGIECSAGARALLGARVGAAPRRCVELTVALDTSGKPEHAWDVAGQDMHAVELWSPPESYLTHLFDR